MEAPRTPPAPTPASDPRAADARAALAAFLPPPAPDPVVYLFKQNVERVEREAADGPEIKESYARDGLLLMTSQRSLTDWVRTFTEYVATPQYLTDLRKKPFVEREELRAVHAKAVEPRKLSFAPESATIITSDPLNAGPGFAGLALPFNLLALPTVVPSAGVKVPDVGAQWRGVVPLKYGFGEFKVRYTARVAAVNPLQGGVRIDVTLDPYEPWAMGNVVLLVMSASGAWSVTLDWLTQIPARSEGRFLLSVRTQWQEGGQMHRFEVGRCGCQFRFETLAASFDERCLSPAGWDHMFAPPDPRTPLGQSPPPPSSPSSSPPSSRSPGVPHSP